MKHAKTLVASVLLVGTVAATSVFAANSMGMGNKTGMGKGNPFSNTGVIQMLKDKGITAPTPEEAKAFETKMKAMQAAEKSLTAEAKVQLETLRQSFRKQEREFYRTQGVVLPTEDEIAKMEAIRDILKPTTGSGAKGPMGGFGMGRGPEDRDGGWMMDGDRGMGRGDRMNGSEWMGPDGQDSENKHRGPRMMNGSGGSVGPQGGMMKRDGQGKGRGENRGMKNGRNNKPGTSPELAPETQPAPVTN